MTAPTPERVAAALRAALGDRLLLEPDWYATSIAAPGRWDPRGVLMHHSAGVNSLRWISTGNPFAPVRAAHLLVGRDGEVHLCSARKAFHAGRGGPLRLPSVTIPRDHGNAYLYGIEIESLGTVVGVGPEPGAITAAQVRSAADAAAALCRVMGVDHRHVVNHRTWAPRRKIDTRLEDRFWQGEVAARLRPRPVGAVVNVEALRVGHRSLSAKQVRRAMRLRGAWWARAVPQGDEWTADVEDRLRRHAARLGLSRRDAVAELGVHPRTRARLYRVVG